jgi:acetyl esterase
MKGEGRVQFDIHPDMSDLLAAKEATPKAGDPDVLRSGWNSYGSRLNRPYPDGMIVRDEHLSVAGAGKEGRIPVRFYWPGNVRRPSPCVVYLHGGAFIKGSLDSGDSIAWGVAAETGFAVMSVDYRLAPENPYPAGVEDCYAAVKTLSNIGERFGVDPDRIAVWGDSAGGNMAAAVCLMARDRAGPRIRAQAINYPCLTDDLNAPAYRDMAEAPGVRASVIDNAWNLYLGARRPTRDGYAAPLKAADLSNLPPAHIHYAEYDCLADDARAYAERLAAAGNGVVLRQAGRMIHGYLRARFTGPDAAAEFAAPCRFLSEHLLGRSGERSA